MIKNAVVGLVVASILSFAAVQGWANSDQHPPKKMVWPFDGVFGHVDIQSAQRGFQVYKQVCAGCHSLKRLSYRNLADIGFTEAEIKALASDVRVVDGPNDEGEMFERPGLASDHFVAPFANDQAARAANGGALPPDLSLIVKARRNGPDYIYSLLTGYEEAPHGEVMPDGMHYNAYFPGKKIAMPAPLTEGAVTYQDGTTASVEQMSRDVVTFLQWAAEPEMAQRKELGFKVMVYLGIFTVLFYLGKRIVWRDVK